MVKGQLSSSLTGLYSKNAFNNKLAQTGKYNRPFIIESVLFSSFTTGRGGSVAGLHQEQLVHVRTPDGQQQDSRREEIQTDHAASGAHPGRGAAQETEVLAQDENLHRVGPGPRESKALLGEVDESHIQAFG